MQCLKCLQHKSEYRGARQVCNPCIEVLNLKTEEGLICEYCGLQKEKDLFSRVKYGIVCKICQPQYVLDQKKEYHKLHYKDYYDKNREKLVQKSILWNQANPDKRALMRKTYRESHKNEIDFRIKENLGFRLRTCLKKNNIKFVEFLQCDIPFLKTWLDFNFTEGMNWNNYGSYWHIDHIIPCKFFKGKSVEEQYKCWVWSNLAPLESKKNASKGSKIDNELIEHYKNRVAEFLKIQGEGSESIRQQADISAQDVLHPL